MNTREQFMQRMTLMAAVATIALAGLVQSAAAQVAVQGTVTAAPEEAAALPIPRLPDGKPDFQGTWYKSRGYQPNGTVVVAPGGGRAAAEPGNTAGNQPQGGAGAAAGGGGAAGTGPNPFGLSSAENAEVFLLHGVKIPYRPEAMQEKRWRAVNQYLDGEPRCHLAGVPRSAEQPPYPHMIIQDDKTVTILYEYVHEPRIIPITSEPHPKNYRAWDGDSRAHWEGDTLVIDVSNFNGRSWLDMTGNFVDENLHVVERYTMTSGNTYLYEAILTDPTVFTEPLKISFELVRQKDEDQIIEYSCLEGESDRQHYTAQTGGVKADAFRDTAVSTVVHAGEATSVHGCLRGDLVDGAVKYSLELRPKGKVPVSLAAGAQQGLRELVDRDVWLNGSWKAQPGKSPFEVTSARAQAEGCAWDGKSP
ncbi:MAG: hypothetical protein QM696_13060 [Steroidobacteraceae bacterium]